MSINIQTILSFHRLLVAHSVSPCIEGQTGQTNVQVMNLCETPIIVHTHTKYVVGVIQPEHNLPNNIMAGLLNGVTNLSKSNKVKLLQKYSDTMSSDKGDLGKLG